MKRKTKANLAVAAFMGVCMVPSLGMLILPETEAAANQALAPVPSLTTQEGRLNLDIFQEITDYVADHFALRQEMITANAALEAAVFRTSAEESVLLGREGWLFYQETMDDYLRLKQMTPRQRYGAARSLALLSEYTERQGARLIFTVAPNKASLYPQYLPNVGQPLEGQNEIDLLIPALEEEEVAYVDLFSPFRSQEEILYHPTDSHWTIRGAALAHDILLPALGKEGEAPFFPESYQTAQEHRGDLYDMLYPTGCYLEEEATFDRSFTFSHIRPIRSPEDQRIETEHTGKSGSLLMFRDSFGNTLYPFLAEEYGKALFSRAMPYQMSLLEEIGADTVLIELVERNLDQLSIHAPIFPAPQRQLQESPAREQSTVKLAAKDDGRLEGYLRLEGTLTGQADPASPIYVELGQVLYEATPVGQAWEEGAPFTLYVPRTGGMESVRVLYLRDGGLREAGSVNIVEST